MNSFKELKVWQKAMDLVEGVYRMSKHFPQAERYALTDQMRRPAVSIPSNIAEGWGRGTTKEYLRFLRVAKGSLMELETQLIIAQRLQYTQAQKVDQLMSQIAEIGRMLNGLISSLKRRL